MSIDGIFKLTDSDYGVPFFIEVVPIENGNFKITSLLGDGEERMLFYGLSKKQMENIFRKFSKKPHP